MNGLILLWGREGEDGVGEDCFLDVYFKCLLLLVFNNLCGKTKIGNGFLEFHALWELWPAMFFNGFFYFIIVIMIFFFWLLFRRCTYFVPFEVLAFYLF